MEISEIVDKLTIIAENNYDYAVDFLDEIIDELKVITPCDLCQYCPPSSFGGKPCTMCPATTERQEV